MRLDTACQSLAPDSRVFCLFVWLGDRSENGTSCVRDDVGNERTLTRARKIECDMRPKRGRKRVVTAEQQKSFCFFQNTLDKPRRSRDFAPA